MAYILGTYDKHMPNINYKVVMVLVLVVVGFFYRLWDDKRFWGKW